VPVATEFTSILAFSLLPDSRNHFAGSKRVPEPVGALADGGENSGYAWWVAAQGCILAGWLIVEIVMLRTMIWAHYLYGAVALTPIVAGLALVRYGEVGRNG